MDGPQETKELRFRTVQKWKWSVLLQTILTWSESWKSHDTKRLGLVRPRDKRASWKTMSLKTFFQICKIVSIPKTFHTTSPEWVRPSVCEPQTRTGRWLYAPKVGLYSKISFQTLHRNDWSHINSLKNMTRSQTVVVEPVTLPVSKWSRPQGLGALLPPSAQSRS